MASARLVILGSRAAQAVWVVTQPIRPAQAAVRVVTQPIRRAQAVGPPVAAPPLRSRVDGSPALCSSAGLSPAA
ncbi:MAG TPA: hypothetical protein VL263_08725 [Vicinamibacterales bacterium]|nr:hypothetical protein [Vicinamibacterales bacterium]